MKTNFYSRLFKAGFIFFLGSIFLGNQAQAQFPNLKMSDFVLYSTGQGVDSGITIIGSSITINGNNFLNGILGASNVNSNTGAVGATKMVQTTGNATINAAIFSGDKVAITNSNVINGKITAANPSGGAGNILDVGSSAAITGDIYVNGNINIGGGSVTGKVTLPNGRSYVGPVPSADTFFVTNSEMQGFLPTLPTLPGEMNLGTAGSGIVTTTPPSPYTPGSYGSINFSGNKTLTLLGPGVYVFKSFAWTGNSNKLIFDFNNLPGKYYIIVEGNADFGKLNASIVRGGSAERIYLETHGDGLASSIPGYSFIIANGSSGGGSKWNGTVYATKSGINIGSGTGSSSLTGAFYSNKKINIQSGVTVYYAPFDFCTPITANAGPDQTDNTTCGKTTVTLAANSPSPGTGLWTSSPAGGTFGNASSPTSTFSGTAGTTYTLTWTITNGSCAASSDNVVVTFNQFPDYNDTIPDRALEFTGTSNLKVVEDDITGASYLWSTIDGEITTSDLTQQEISVSSAGVYILKVSSSGCDIKDTVNVTSKLNSVIGSELQSVFDNFDPNNPDRTFFDIDDESRIKIDIIVFAEKRAEVLGIVTQSRAQGYGLIEDFPNGDHLLTITGYFPIENLPNLNLLYEIIKYCRPYYRPFPNMGETHSQGDTTMRSNLVRSGYRYKKADNTEGKIDGTGIKIGILSNSFATITETTDTTSLEPIILHHTL